MPMTAQPYKTWRVFDCTEDAIHYRREHGTGGWIFSISDNGEAILFPWQMTPTEVLESVFVQHRHGYLIGSDEQRIAQDHLRDHRPPTAVLHFTIRPDGFADMVLGRKQAQAQP